ASRRLKNGATSRRRERLRTIWSSSLRTPRPSPPMLDFSAAATFRKPTGFSRRQGNSRSTGTFRDVEKKTHARVGIFHLLHRQPLLGHRLSHLRPLLSRSGKQTLHTGRLDRRADDDARIFPHGLFPRAVF